MGDKVYSHGSNCIYSITNPIGTLLSSLCQMLIKSSWLYSGSGVGSLTQLEKSQSPKLIPFRICLSYQPLWSKSILAKMAGIKSTSGITPAKQNGLSISLLMIKSKQAHISLLFLVKIYIYLAKRKNVTIFSAYSKCPLLIASKKATTS